MGNFSSAFHQMVQNKPPINNAAFDYYRKNGATIKQGAFEFETDDFTKIEEIRQKLLSLPDQNAIAKHTEDICVALTNYLNGDKEKNAILSQTDYFVFKTQHNILPLLSIKNTKADANRNKLHQNNVTVHQNNLTETSELIQYYYVAACDLSKLWKANT